MVGRIKKEERKRNIIRRHVLLKRENQSLKQIKQKSALIKEHLFKLSEYKKARMVMFYTAKSGEVETKNMIQDTLELKKKVVVPKVKGKQLLVSLLKDWNKDLKTGAFGIKEPKEEALRPVSEKKIDLVILPGICFDEKKNRLGYGRGYFDRFLAKLPKKTKTIGLAFDLQIVKSIPRLSQDKICLKVITEKRVIC